MNNSLISLILYRTGPGGWSFDDEPRGILGEPFVCGIPEIIDDAMAGVGVTGDRIRIIFAAQPFPSKQMTLIHMGSDSGGNWYEWKGQRGWLCPTLFKYFDKAPTKIYVRIEAL